MAEPKPVGVLEFLGDIPYGEVQGTLRDCGSLGGFTREDDPDPVDVGSGPVPRSVVRLVALEAALWDGLGDPRTADVIAREAGVEVSMVARSIEILEILRERYDRAWKARLGGDPLPPGSDKGTLR